MIIFARKHYSKENARLFSLMIHLAVYFRASLSIINRFVSHILLPVMDVVLTFLGIYFIKGYWERGFIFPEGGHYPPAFIQIVVPVYIFIWLICVYFSGGYERPIRLIRILRGMMLGTLIILVIYSLLPEYIRFSKALIIMGALWGTLVMFAIRGFLHLISPVHFRISSTKNKRFVIIGEKEEAERVAQLLEQTGMTPSFTGLVSFHHHRKSLDGFLGHLGQIKEIITIHKIDEVIFCAKDVPAQVIIDKMSEMKDAQVDFKIAPPESLSIIGSNSINTSGDLYIIDINAITKKINRRNKRLLDLTASAFLLMLSPLFLFVVKNPIGFIRNVFVVLFARKSWVGYIHLSHSDHQHLPDLKKGILTPLDALNRKEISEEALLRLNFLYARDYKVQNDMIIIFKGIRNLGRR
jgi:hypothetical protein